MVKVYVCPHCGDESKKRADCRKHLAEKHPGEQGSCMMIEKEDEKKKVKKVSSKSKRSKKYGCPQCNRSFKSLGAVKDHMKSKRHAGEPVMEQETPAKKKEEPKKEEPKVVVKEKEYLCSIRILPEDAERIRPSLIEGVTIEVNPQSGNYILNYLSTKRPAVDWYKFHFNFVEVEMENSDVLFCLGKFEPTAEFNIYDMASLKTFGIADVLDDGVIQADFEASKKMENSILMGRLLSADSEALASVSGIWKKVYTPPAKTTPAAPVQSKLPAPVQKPVTEVKKQKSVEKFDDWKVGVDLKGTWDMDGYASEQEENLVGGRWGGGGSYPYYQRSYQPKPYVPPPPPKPTQHPVYAVLQSTIVTDRTVDFSIFD